MKKKFPSRLPWSDLFLDASDVEAGRVVYKQAKLVNYKLIRL